MAAVSAAGHFQSEQEFLLAALHSAGDLLDVSCSVFYSASTTPPQSGPVRVNQRAANDLAVPETLPVAFTEHLLRQGGGVLVSSEWDALATVAPSFDFACCSSLWISVADAERTFGTLAFFDHASRRFERTQRKIAELVGGVLALGLQSQAARQSTHTSEAVTYHEFSKLIGGVARDLINPLTALFGYVELLKAELNEGRPAHLVRRMEEQIEKARRIIATFSSSAKSVTGHAERISTASAVPPLDWTIGRERLSSRIPAQEATIPTTQLWDCVPAESNGSRILLIQRSEPVFEFQRSVLSALGADVIPAFSSADALEQLRGKEVDAIILDDELEDSGSSKKLVWWVRENRPDLAERMLLTVSRKPTPETKEILEIAMLPHVTKPLEVLELYSRAQQILRAGRTSNLLQ